jgi:hypothetical protein
VRSIAIHAHLLSPPLRQKKAKRMGHPKSRVGHLTDVNNAGVSFANPGHPASR